MNDLVPQRQHLPGDLTPPAATAWGAPRQEKELTLRDVWGMVRRNLLLIAGCVALAAAAAAVVTVRSTPIYEATTSIRIDEKQAGLPALDVLRPLAAGSEVTTEMEILASRSLAEGVTTSLALQLRLRRPQGASRDSLFTDIKVAPDARYAVYRLLRTSDGRFELRDTPAAPPRVVAPGDRVQVGGAEFRLAHAAERHEALEFEVLPFHRAVRAVRSAVKVLRPNRDVSIVVVRYRDTDPTLVRDVPNALTARFMAHRQEGKQTAARSTVSFLREQLARLSVQLNSAEDALRAFRQRQQVVSLPEEARTQVGRMAELRARRAALETERSALAQLMAEARASATDQRPGEPSPYRNLLAFPTLLGLQSASQLLGSLTAIEDRRAELLTRRAPRDPDVLVLTTRIRELEEQLRRTAETYLRGLTDQVAAIDVTLAQSEMQLVRIPAKEAEFARRDREAKGLEEIYTLLRSRLKEAEIAAAVEDGSVRVVDAAVMSTRPVAPSPARNLALALAVGLLIGVAGSFAREFADRSVHSRNDVEALSGSPVLGLIPKTAPTGGWMSRLRRGWRAPAATSAPRHATVAPGSVAEADRAAGAARASEHAAALVATPGDTWSPVQEAYNRLQTNVSFAMAADGVGRTVVVTSPLPGEGKTTVSVSLAATLARLGHSVLLVDADLRRGIVHSLFGIPRAPGLSDMLLGTAEAGQAIRTVGLDDRHALCVLSTGRLYANPTHVLGPGRIQTLLRGLGKEFDWVIVDSPPVNVVADAALLGATGAGVLLVARAGVTPSDALVYAVEQLRGVRASLIGTILNDIDKREASYDSAYRYYGYAAAYHAGQAK